MKFIFEVRIKDSSSPAQYIEAWKEGSSIIQKQSGALGTRLHKKIGEDGVYLAIANWESKDARDTAMKALAEVDDETKEKLKAHENFGDITIIGSFDEVSEIHHS